VFGWARVVVAAALWARERARDPVRGALLHSQRYQLHGYNHPARRSNIRVLSVSGFISPFKGAKCFLMREPMRNITG
jgi:hypothetical protein